MTGPRSPRGKKAKRSILDRKVSAREAVTKGSTGDGIVAQILRDFGWTEVVDLDRCFPGCDLLAICACPLIHLLWAEVKAYPLGGIETDSWEHLTATASRVSARRRERFALFTYQKSITAGRPPNGTKAQWWASPWYAGAIDNPQTVISLKAWLSPPCATPLPTGIVSNPPSTPRDTVGEHGTVPTRRGMVTHGFDTRLSGTDVGESTVTHDSAATCQDPRCPNAPRAIEEP